MEPVAVAGEEALYLVIKNLFGFIAPIEMDPNTYLWGHPDTVILWQGRDREEWLAQRVTFGVGEVVEDVPEPVEVW